MHLSGEISKVRARTISASVGGVRRFCNSWACWTNSKVQVQRLQQLTHGLRQPQAFAESSERGFEIFDDLFGKGPSVSMFTGRNSSERVTVQFDTECTDVVWGRGEHRREQCTVSLQRRSTNTNYEEVKYTISTPFLIGADGTNSKVRKAMSRQNPMLKARTYKDQNIRWYRTVPLHVPKFPPVYVVDGCTYSARSRVPNADINLEALPTKEGVHLAVILYRSNDKYVTALRTEQDSVHFFQQHFPMFLPFLRPQDHAQFAIKGDSRFQRFQYVGPELHVGSSAVLVGDSVHTVKPYFGLGVNSALEDVAVLQQALRMHNVSVANSSNESAVKQRGAALAEYTKLRYPEGRALVELSHYFDKGLIQFLLPLIVDKFLHIKFPKSFSPPVLRQLQDERNGFVEVRRRKSRERVVQFAALFTMLATVVLKCSGRLSAVVAPVASVVRRLFSSLMKALPAT